MDRRFFVFACVFFIFLLIVNGAFLFVFGRSVRQQATLNQVAIDERIEKIVLGTLYKVREDLDILTPSSTNQAESQEEKNKKITIEGANLSTFEHHFYIDNTPFFIGDVVSPYGMAVAIGRDFVIFDDFNGGQVILGKSLPSRPDRKEEEKKPLDSEKKV